MTDRTHDVQHYRDAAQALAHLWAQAAPFSVERLQVLRIMSAFPYRLREVFAALIAVELTGPTQHEWTCALLEHAGVEAD
jgi:hypothetical protein